MSNIHKVLETISEKSTPFVLECCANAVLVQKDSTSWFDVLLWSFDKFNNVFMTEYYQMLFGVGYNHTNSF